jgi:hypothetical protein
VKLLIAAGMICCPLTLPPPASGQDDQAVELKHLTVAPQNGNRTVALAALTIERGAHYPSVVKLKGNVEIKTPVCLPVGKESELICDGQMIVRADEAEFHEDTGQIEAHGNVSVTPLVHEH